MSRKKGSIPVLRLRSPIGMALERYRMAKRLEPSDLVKQVGLSSKTLSHIEGSHKPRPTNYTLERLAKALGEDFEYLCRLRLVGLRHPITVGDMKEDDPELRIRSSLGRGLRRTRLILNISQSELARKARTTQKIIERIENDPDYKPNRAILDRIADAIGVSVASLLALREQ